MFKTLKIEKLSLNQILQHQQQHKLNITISITYLQQQNTTTQNNIFKHKQDQGLTKQNSSSELSM